MTNPFQRARSFLLSQGRLLERLLFGVVFEHASPASIGHLLRAYQNPDGGLGHALEPDVRCPESQPLFVEIGLQALHDARLRDPELALSLCGFLESVSDPTGLVPLILPNALASPHAVHMNSAPSPDLNPTAGICGLLHYQGIRHPWLERATQTCCELLLHDPPREAHALRSAAHLVEHLPDQGLAERLAGQIALALPEALFYIPFTPVTTYGLTPLHFATSPASPWRTLFTQEQLERHLADLLACQQEDGGWPIRWPAPGPAALSEWRGRWTLEALMVLVAYGCIEGL